MTYQEWKAQKAARAAGSGAVIDLGAIRARLAESDRVLALSRASREREKVLRDGGVNLTTVGADGEPVKPLSPAWERALEEKQGDPMFGAIRAGRVKDLADYRRVKRAMEGGDAA
jgi:hypothetical protein